MGRIVVMTQASKRGFGVSKPWGDAELYDVVLEREGCFLRVQVKSTDKWQKSSYICGLRAGGGRSYTARDLDFFGIYVVPDDIWYIFPASRLIGKWAISLSPHRKDRENECYKEAWALLPRRPRGRNANVSSLDRPRRKSGRRDSASGSK